MWFSLTSGLHVGSIGEGPRQGLICCVPKLAVTMSSRPSRLKSPSLSRIGKLPAVRFEYCGYSQSRLNGLSCLGGVRGRLTWPYGVADWFVEDPTLESDEDRDDVREGVRRGNVVDLVEVEVTCPMPPHRCKSSQHLPRTAPAVRIEYKRERLWVVLAA